MSHYRFSTNPSFPTVSAPQKVSLITCARRFMPKNNTRQSNNDVSDYVIVSSDTNRRWPWPMPEILVATFFPDRNFRLFLFFFGLPMRWFEITNAVLCSGEVRNVTVWQLNGERNAISIVRGLTRKSHFFCNLLYVTGYEKFILSQVVKRKCTKINF